MSEMMCLVRYFNRDQVIREYGIQPHFEDEFFQECPVAWHSKGEPAKGEAVYRESDVDEFVRHFRVPAYRHPSRRSGGVSSTEETVAALANSLRSQGRSWKEVAQQVNATPAIANHGKRRSSESIRKLVERYMGRRVRKNRTVGHAVDASGDNQTRIGGHRASRSIGAKDALRPGNQGVT